MTFSKKVDNHAFDDFTAAAKKMTTHADADNEVAALKKRYDDVKSVAESWVKKLDILLKEWILLGSVQISIF